MKYLHSFFTFLLLQITAGLIRTYPISEQTCTRGTFFSLRIDDHFEGELIINATVFSPNFLSISERKVKINHKGTLAPDFNMNFTAMTFYDDKAVILEKSGIVVYQSVLGNVYYNKYNPSLLQYYRDPSLSKYFKISGGKTFAVFNSFSFQLFMLENSEYPVKVSELNHTEEIIDIIISKENILIIGDLSVTVYKLIDYELGWISKITEIDYKSLGFGEIHIEDVYTKPAQFYLLDQSKGVLVFSYFPVQFSKILKYTGKKISGYENSLIIDGKIEIDLPTLSLKYYSQEEFCSYLSIDKNYIYCANTRKVNIISRLLNISESIYIGLIHEFQVLHGLSFFGLSNRVEIYEPEYGDISIQGRVPDEVSDYTVVYSVSSESNEIKDSFLLSIQYSLANLIVFILLSFIIIFGSVFICSSICRYMTSDVEEKPAENQATEGQGGTTERNLNSARQLIPRSR